MTNEKKVLIRFRQKLKKCNYSTQMNSNSVFVFSFASHLLFATVATPVVFFKEMSKWLGFHLQFSCGAYFFCLDHTWNSRFRTLQGWKVLGKLLKCLPEKMLLH